jgi:2-keto-4-pentenoate hydratase/2-oxohepta-3-ene-1,7-dioic acid hydratase in catechol pathway
LTSHYRHRWANGSAIDLPVGKVVCVGRNYAEHAKELNNPVPTVPLLFIKPSTSLAPLESPLAIPQQHGAVHHEVELALLIGQKLDKNSHSSKGTIAAMGIALDLTLRDVQSKLKQQGQPWEIAKGFDGACPCSAFVDINAFAELQAVDFSLQVNGKLRQAGYSGDMVFPMTSLLMAMAQYFTLLPGDIVLTGTPAGVGPLHTGDQLHLTLADQYAVNTQVLR